MFAEKEVWLFSKQPNEVFSILKDDLTLIWLGFRGVRFEVGRGGDSKIILPHPLHA